MTPPSADDVVFHIIYSVCTVALKRFRVALHLTLQLAFILTQISTCSYIDRLLLLGEAVLSGTGIKVENQDLPSAGQDCPAPQQAIGSCLLLASILKRRNSI